jgi:dolichol-phosphate mannosyltransferase
VSQHVAPRSWSTLSRFLLVGGSGVLVNSFALFVLYQLAGLPFVIASVLAVELAITNNFIWNDRWTFGRTRRSAWRFLKFNLVSLVGLVLTASTDWLLIQRTGMNYLMANLVGIALATICNFLANAHWTWRP